jgi:hypothetical protein
MQAYTLIAQARAPAGIMGATMATLSFARQIGGSAGIALFGWITLLAAGPAGLSLAFALAVLALAIALVTAPRSSHDSPVTEEPIPLQSAEFRSRTGTVVPARQRAGDLSSYSRRNPDTTKSVAA